MLLSLIIPFYNSKHKCERLLNTLKYIDDHEVEIILVDDGSVDGTGELLEKFKNDSKVTPKVIHQANKGPGGARNHGLSVASGEYVWFVDSDDDINLAAIECLKQKSKYGYDFIDFNIKSKSRVVNTLEIDPGEYCVQEEVKNILLKKWSRFVAKIFLREFIVSNRLLFPENCVYEDLFFVFIMPFYAKRFFKSNIIGYYHHEEYNSVTRGEASARFYDRLVISKYGMIEGISLSSNENEKKKLHEKFIRLYLLNTVAQTFTRYPSKYWVVSLIVMSMYRKEAAVNKIEISPLKLLSGSWKYKAIFILLYTLSCFIPRYHKFTDKCRESTWGVGVSFPAKEDKA